MRRTLEITDAKWPVVYGGITLGVILIVVALQSSSKPSDAQTDDAISSTQHRGAGLPDLGADDFPEVENGWYSVPPWAEGLPFDLESKLATQPQDNREQLYCQILAQWNPMFGHSVFPAYQAVDAADLQRLSDESRKKIRLVTDFVFDRQDGRGFSASQTNDELGELQNLLLPFDAGLEQLKQTGQRKQCFFHSEWLPSSVSHVYDGRDVMYILTLKCNSERSNSESLRWVELALQFRRDLVGFGNQVEQIVGGSMARMVFDSMVTPMLQRSDLTVAELDQLIETLIAHDAERRQSDLCLEATKREILELRHVLDLLATGRFLTEERRQRLDLDPDDQLTTALLREVVDYGYYRVNSDQVHEEVERLAQSNDLIRKAWDEAQIAWKDQDDSQEGARILLGFFLSDRLESVGAQSVERDIEVLNKRYRQVAETCQMPYPDSHLQLSKLQDRWTLDDSWKQTAFLRWFQPLDRIANERRGAQLWRSAHLALAVIRRWQIQHDGQDPPDLESAFREYGIQQVPSDPYSGKPLRLINGTPSIGTYSIGPDGKDDRGKVVYDPFNMPIGTPAIGDFVFVLKKQKD